MISLSPLEETIAHWYEKNEREPTLYGDLVLKFWWLWYWMTSYHFYHDPKAIAGAARVRKERALQWPDPSILRMAAVMQRIQRKRRNDSNSPPGETSEKG